MADLSVENSGMWNKFVRQWHNATSVFDPNQSKDGIVATVILVCSLGIWF
ncbi:MAG: hypothetical protein Q4P24_05490 [Rhodobacterales bacterium]|nr:hypothetical protein [Rhodobacterales bacterium]